jgi:hypothetical protein
MYRWGGTDLLGLIYFFVAGGEGYLDAGRTLEELVAGVLAIIVWPLVPSRYRPSLLTMHTHRMDPRGGVGCLGGRPPSICRSPPVPSSS